MILSLIGPGRVGAALLRHADACGCTIDTVVAREPAAASLGGELHARLVTHDIGALPGRADVVLVTVTDTALSEVAATLAAQASDWSGRVVAHASGALTCNVLAPLHDCGAITGSLHPIQSFPAAGLPPEALHAIGCGIEGDDSFVECITPLVDTLGWRALRVPTDAKPLYHAACVVAGNFLTVLCDDASTLLGAATGSPHPLTHLIPMMRQILCTLETTAPIDALTGPAARGDSATIDRHLQALSSTHPELHAMYVTLTERIAANVQTTGRENRLNSSTLQLFNSSTHPTNTDSTAFQE